MMVWMSAYPLVVTSPATTTRPVVVKHSTATREYGSCAISASRIASLHWSAILSGCPSVTLSDVKYSILTMFIPHLFFYWLLISKNLGVLFLYLCWNRPLETHSHTCAF